MPENEHNGPGFHYIVRYKLHGTSGEPQSTTMDDPTMSEVIIHHLQTFSRYEVSVQAANDVNISTAHVDTIIGYSGEGSEDMNLIAIK